MARFHFGTTPANFVRVDPPLAPPLEPPLAPYVTMAGGIPGTQVDPRPGTVVADGYENGIRPVTGWLVCIKGADMGKDFRLHSQHNYIGRSAAADVCLNDPKVSREPSVEIAYDPFSRAFFVASCHGTMQITYLNNRPLMGDRDLVNGDVLRLGDTELIFVPLCGENFAWPEDEQ